MAGFSHDLMSALASPSSMAVLRDHARGLFDAVLAAADRETLLMLNPLLARLVQGSERSHWMPTTRLRSGGPKCARPGIRKVTGSGLHASHDLWGQSGKV